MIVVGRSPDLTYKGMGEEIDKHDTVIRLTNGLYGYDYGYKIDHIVFTGLQIPYLRGMNLTDTKSLWLYWTQRPRNAPGKGTPEWVCNYVKKRYFNGEIVAINKYIDKYLKLYKETAKIVKKTVDYPTKGTVAVLTAMALLKPKELCLAGFDGVMSGKPSPDRVHDWPVEKMLIEQAGKDYSVCVTCL